MLRRKLFNILAADQENIYWDSDQTFLNDPYHDAGLFVSDLKKLKEYTNFEWIVDDFRKQKNTLVPKKQ
jgi:hypothetical protein